MSILEEVGKIAGAVAAVEALEKVNPDAGLLAKASAAVGGFGGVQALEEVVEKIVDGHRPADSTTAAQNYNQQKA